MIKKFTEHDMQNYADYVAKTLLSNTIPTLDRWYASGNKPAKKVMKVIDLSVLIKSGIDCEFSAMSGAYFNRKLINIATTNRFDGRYQDDHNCFHKRCRPRMNHKHAWQGGECPLPEGFEVKVWYRDDLRYPDTLMNSGVYTNTGWVHKNNGRDIIAFEVLGVADDHVIM